MKLVATGRELGADKFNDNESIHGTTPMTSSVNLWSSATERLKRMILHLLKKIACYSAINPGRIIVLITITSIALLLVGFNTNFKLVTNNRDLFTPFGSLSENHQGWIENQTDFADVANVSYFSVHSGGKNVLSVEGVSRVFKILSDIKALKSYSQICRSDKDNACKIGSVTNFWSSDPSAFMAKIPIYDDEEVIRVMSSKAYPNGALVHRQSIFGNSEPFIRFDRKDYSDEDTLLQTAEMYQSGISYPNGPEINEFEKEFSDLMSSLRKEWKNDGSEWRLEYLVLNTSVELEMKRAIDADSSLLVLAFGMMFLLCALYFAKRDLVQSQSMLGIGAVLSVLLSSMAVFGFLFCVGVPFTAMTQILPFILAGIGLDDAFIITSAFSRTDPNMEVANRVSKAIDEIGISIFLSTTTTFLAFMLSSISKVPAMRWFCFYAAPCVIVDFLFQISFFISYLVYDQRRMKVNRYDILCCWKSIDSESQPASAFSQVPENILSAKGQPVAGCLKSIDSESQPASDLNQVPEEELSATGQLVAGCRKSIDNESQPASDLSKVPVKELSATGQLVAAYIDILLRPVTKVIVLLIFATILALGIFSAMAMTQYFDFTMLFRSDSYATDYFYGIDHYANKFTSVFSTSIYFRK